METFKSWLLSILILILIVGAGFWAFNSIESGGDHVSNQELKNLQKENEELKGEIDKLEGELALYKPVAESALEENNAKENEEVPVETQDTSSSTAYKYQSLIAELEKLITDNISMKLKSRGTRVGTIQNFLNLYNNTSNKIDNDYGEGTKKLVIAFQKVEGLTADGEAGPGTFAKMIEWLKKQG